MSIVKTISRWCIVGVAASSVSAWASYKNPPITAEVGFVNMSTLPAGSDQINPIRMQALQETSYKLGAQGALAWRSLQIDATLQAEERQLDHVFDFNQLLINGDVMPPVIDEADQSLNLSSADAIRTATKIYRIVSPAQFTTTAPNWRTYLWMDYPKPNMPDHTLLPTTQVEAEIWNASLQSGWKEGIDQGNAIFAVNINRLKRDYVGMVLYRKLLDQHMVSAPSIAQAELGVTGNSQEIRINDQVTRITAPSGLQPNSNKWTPVLTNTNGQ